MKKKLISGDKMKNTKILKNPGKCWCYNQFVIIKTEFQYLKTVNTFINDHPNDLRKIPLSQGSHLV